MTLTPEAIAALQAAEHLLNAARCPPPRWAVLSDDTLRAMGLDPSALPALEGHPGLRLVEWQLAR